MTDRRSGSRIRIGAAAAIGAMALGSVLTAPAAQAADNLETGDLEITHQLNAGHRFEGYGPEWNDGYGPIPIMTDTAVDGSPVDLGNPQDLWDGNSWQTPAAAEDQTNPWGYFIRNGDHLLPQVMGTVDPIPAPQCVADTVRIHATAEIENLGPTPGVWTLGNAYLFNAGVQADSQSFGRSGTSTPVGTVVPIELTGEVPLAAIQNGDIDFLISIETYHNGPKAWEFRDFHATYDVLCDPAASGVERTVLPNEPTTVDLTGQVVTDLVDPDWGTLSLRDGDGDPVKVLTTDAGTYEVVGSTVVFTPDPDFPGGEAPPVTWLVEDTDGNAAEAGLDLLVARPPVGDPLRTSTEATDPVTVDPLDGAEARDGATIDPASVRLVGSEGELVTELTIPDEGTYTVDPDSGEIEFVAVPGFDGISTATYSIADSRGLRGENVVEIEVTRIPAQLELSADSIRADDFTAEDGGIEATIAFCRAGEDVRFTATPLSGQDVEPIVVDAVADETGTATAVFSGSGQDAAFVGDYEVTATCGDVELTTAFAVTAAPEEPATAPDSGDESLATTGGGVPLAALWSALGLLAAGGALAAVRVIRARRV
ncbi:Ig-like domain-containing protein [Microbacterium sp. NPDC058345]|uniref:Ig-like domain-containing protein n=1 Tax=Microbacterium sp. NPDC058345 TaxID=3346455 RepID=UPI003664AE6E